MIILKFNKLVLHNKGTFSEDYFYPIRCENIYISSIYLSAYFKNHHLTHPYLSNFIWYIKNINTYGSSIDIELKVVGVPLIKATIKGVYKNHKGMGLTKAELFKTLNSSDQINYITKVANMAQLKKIRKINQLRIQKAGQLWNITQSLKPRGIANLVGLLKTK